MGGGGCLRIIVAALLLFAACGGGDGSSEPAASDDDSAGSDVKIDYGADYGNECLEVEKGPVFKVEAGAKNETGQFGGVTWYPSTIKAPAGEFITLEIINPSRRQHDFTSDDLDCQTESLGRGETVTVSFEVPKGETDFVCAIHEAFMTGDIIGTK